jgi:hypothetical protein
MEMLKPPCPCVAGVHCSCACFTALCHAPHPPPPLATVCALPGTYPMQSSSCHSLKVVILLSIVQPCIDGGPETLACTMRQTWRRCKSCWRRHRQLVCSALCKCAWGSRGRLGEHVPQSPASVVLAPLLCLLLCTL